MPQHPPLCQSIFKNKKAAPSKEALTQAYIRFISQMDQTKNTFKQEALEEKALVKNQKGMSL